ncbi:MAG: thiolase family protein [Nocardioides sp.]|jgi:acetyl-CoA C-acetyltransferase
MTEAVIVAGARTAIGTAYKGSLVNVSAFELAEAVVKDLVVRAGLSGDQIDDLVLAENLYGGGVVGRHVAVSAGLTSVPGLSLNRHCAAGLSAISVAAANIMAGMQQTVIAGGTNSQSTAPRTSWRDPATGEEHKFWISPSHPNTPTAPNMDMSLTVGHNTAVEAGLTRLDMDEWTFESHRKALAAIAAGHFAGEIVPLKVDRGDEGTALFEVDEHPRASTMEKLASLKVLHPEIDGFEVTAASSAGLNDAAAGLVLMSAERAAERGLKPLAVVRSWASVGVAPERTGMAPIEAIPKALALAGGRAVSDVDLWEINEAFASVPIAATRALGIDPSLVNPVGSGCSLGHPISASGARMIVSLVNELGRRGGGTGVAAMCAGGGMGQAVVLEVAGS